MARLVFNVVASFTPARAALAQDVLPVPAAEQWYNWTDDGIRHYVYEYGNAGAPGDTVVVLHGGFGAEHSYLLEPLAPLADRYRFVFYDQRGSLRSPAPDSTITLDRLVADLDDLRRALRIDKLTLVAHSMGNALAYAYLAAHPDRVRGLVLVGAVHPATYTGGPNMRFIRNVMPAADSAELASGVATYFANARARAKKLLDAEGLLPDSLRKTSADELEIGRLGEDRQRTRAWRILFTSVNSCSAERWREMRGGQVFYNAAVGRAVQSDGSYAERGERFWPALQSFRGPVRVIMGTCDYVDLGPVVWPRIVERLPDGKLTIIENAGHSLWMDDPVAFQDALAAALGDIDA